MSSNQKPRQGALSKALQSCFAPCISDDRSPNDTRANGRRDPRDVATGGAKQSQSWVDFLKAYGAGSTNPSFIPAKPDDMPEDEKYLKAPLGPDEKARQLEMYKYSYLDEPTYHDGKAGDVSVEDEGSPQSQTLFRIVTLARNTFKTKVALISLLDDECQYFKSEVGFKETGMEGVEVMPRDISFCGHTILNKAPMVILDCAKDWRMAGNPLVVNPPHVRFYAGAPIIAPEGFALGTLCIIDDQPRESFDGAAKMVEFSKLAMQEIRSLYERNQQEKMQKMQESLAQFPAPSFTNAASAHVATALELEEARLQTALGLPGEKAKLKTGRNQGLKVVAKTGTLTAARSESRGSTSPNGGHSRNTSLGTNLVENNIAEEHTPHAELAAPLDRDRIVAPDQAHAASDSRPMVTEQPTNGTTELSTPTNNPYDLAIQLISQTLNLDLVYLLALDPSSSAPGGLTSRVISSHGLAADPVFDTSLHARALKSKSGLLYVHPDPASTIAKEMPNTYVSGMLVPVLQLNNTGGYVLAAFTKKKQQIFQAEDLKFLRDFGISLMNWLLNNDRKTLET